MPSPTRFVWSRTYDAPKTSYKSKVTSDGNSKKGVKASKKLVQKEKKKMQNQRTNQDNIVSAKGLGTAFPLLSDPSAFSKYFSFTCLCWVSRCESKPEKQEPPVPTYLPCYIAPPDCCAQQLWSGVCWWLTGFKAIAVSGGREKGTFHDIITSQRIFVIFQLLGNFVDFSWIIPSYSLMINGHNVNLCKELQNATINPFCKLRLIRIVSRYLIIRSQF